MQRPQPRGATSKLVPDLREPGGQRSAADRVAGQQSQVVWALAIVFVLCVLSLTIVWVMVLIGGGSAAIGVEKLGVKTALGGTFALFFAVFWALTRSFRTIFILLPVLLAVVISGPTLYLLLPTPSPSVNVAPPGIHAPAEVVAKAPHPSENQSNVAAVPSSPPQPAPAVPAASRPEPATPPAYSHQPATADIVVLRRRIAEWASSRSCALLGGDVTAGGVVTLSGLAGHGSIEEMRQSLTGLVPSSLTDWRVIGVNRVFCAALIILHSIGPGFGASAERHLELQMDGKSRLHDGEPVRVRLTMPDFPSWLRVDYLDHDGSVQHLYPQLADAKLGIIADQPRTFRAGEAIDLGNPKWLIGPPYGTDMIIGVASTQPLFDRPRPSNAEPTEAYLRDLQAAIDALRQRGAKLTGSAITLEALP